MSWEVFAQLVGHLAWPLVVVVGILAFRRQIVELMRRTREFEGPGGFKLTISATDVKAVAEQVAKGAITPEQGAEKLERAALDRKAYRILRALLDEEKGRNLYGYATYERSFYGPVLQSLLEDGLIERRDRKYFLTEKGMEVLRAYLTEALRRKPPPRDRSTTDA